MNWGTRLRPAAALCVGLMLQACIWLPQPVTSRAFFVSTPQDAEAVRAFAREQDRQVQGCAAVQACDRVHYLLALAALYEDRDAAVRHFQAAAADAPNGRYAASSLQWVRLLENGQDGSQYQAVLTRAAERLVWDILERETAVEARQKDAQAVQLLKRQLKEYEKKIDELTQQIDALKRVDREVKEQVKPGRPAK
jgi:hypothetical protein